MMQAAKAETLHKLLGGFLPTEFAVLDRRPVPATGFRADAFILQNADGEEIRGYMTGPVGEWQNLPAVLYIHAHGNRYDIGADELVKGRPALLQPAYASALADKGIVAFCVDLHCFGTRAGQSESALAKYYLWRGRTLFGAMLADLAGALTVMEGLAEIDAMRMGVIGLSMGATLAFWLTALDQRIRAVAHLCSFADLEMLTHSGAHDLHGIYMTVPGLLESFKTGEIAGLVAPRPQLVCLGLQDPLTPPPAAHRGIRDLRNAYLAAGAEQNLAMLLSPDTGHAETPEMREAALAFLMAQLQPPAC